MCRIITSILFILFQANLVFGALFNLNSDQLFEEEQYYNCLQNRPEFLISSTIEGVGMHEGIALVDSSNPALGQYSIGWNEWGDYPASPVWNSNTQLIIEAGDIFKSISFDLLSAEDNPIEFRVLLVSYGEDEGYNWQTDTEYIYPQ